MRHFNVTRSSLLICSGICITLLFIYAQHHGTGGYQRTGTDRSVEPLGKQADYGEREGFDAGTGTGTKSDDVTNIELLPDALIGAAADDPRLIQYIRNHMFVEPSPGPRELTHPDVVHYSQANQSTVVDAALHHREDGFFVDCGAAGGEALSNSLFFEKSRNWRGLLVEANPEYYDVIRAKRGVDFVSACLSPTGRAEVLNFTFAKMMGGLSDHIEESHEQVILDKQRITSYRNITCVPLYSLLLALDVSHVDYFSLDVEGPELDILQTIPFDKVTIDILTIEFSVGLCTQCAITKLNKLNDFFAKLGNYEQYAVLKHRDVVYKRIQ